jgi:hypothetical protein
MLQFLLIALLTSKITDHFYSVDTILCVNQDIIFFNTSGELITCIELP